MRAIVSFTQPFNGEIARVGTNHQTLYSDLTTERGVLNRARKDVRAKAGTFRIEFYTDARPYGEPFKVLTVKG